MSDTDNPQLDQALQAVIAALRTGQPPRDLADELAAHPLLGEIVADLIALYEFTLQTANGDLSPRLLLKGALAGGLKTLQASLRHLTWQTQQIAKGDLTQRVDFMGDFSTAFNSMVHALAEARAQVERQQAELRRAYDDLSASNAQLTLLVQELEAFAHTVAHDLKNPLSNIIGYAALLTEPVAPLDAQDVSGFSARIVQGGQKAVSIINELLLLSSVRKLDGVPLKPLDMAAIVAEVQERLRRGIAESGAEFTLPESWPAALGYAPWVEEVWANYISNAIKYGGAPPRVALGAESAGGGMVRFWVRDNGAGIQPEAQARLFMQFTRLDGPQHVEGHGLGLSIVKRIVEKLGGEVGVQSVEGQGSTFSFTLPAA